MVVAPGVARPRALARTRVIGIDPGTRLAGYAIVDNLWASVGFNFIGFSDDDLVESDYTRRGLYLRLRFKFDETLFRGRDRQWNNSLSATTADGQQK